MSARKSSKQVLEFHDPSKLRGTLKAIGGSMADDWNNFVANQTIQTHWLRGVDGEDIRRIRHATVDVLIGIAPRDEFEGMIAAQLVACHNASMECYRRAMIGEQTFEGRRENLNQANKLSRTYATLLETLNRHRGKGQQKVTVEHVHVHSGGQAVVGVVEKSGTGSQAKSEDQCDAKQIAHAPQPAMRSLNADPEPVPSTSNAERPLQNARRKFAGSTEGK
jgi:hypothetical protein